MKKFFANGDGWCKCKALTFFQNFIANHAGRISRAETFVLASELLSAEEWVCRIKSRFSERKLKVLQNSSDVRNSVEKSARVVKVGVSMFSEYRFVEVSNSMTFRPPQIHSLFFPASDFENFSKFSKPNHFYVVSNRVEVKRIFRF